MNVNNTRENLIALVMTVAFLGAYQHCGTHRFNRRRQEKPA